MDAADLDYAAPAIGWSTISRLIRPVRDRLAPPRPAAGAEPPPDDLLAWSRRYLPSHFTLPPSSMHRWLAAWLDRMRLDRGLKLNCLGPRGGAKSTLATLAFALRAALENQEPYIWIVSDTRHQAHAHLENLKAELVDNRLLAAAYPSVAGQGPVWRAGAVQLRNGVSVEAFGTGQRIRGRRRRQHRPTLILCDDLQNDSHIQSALQRQRSRTWFHGTLLKAGTPPPTSSTWPPRSTPRPSPWNCTARPAGPPTSSAPSKRGPPNSRSGPSGKPSTPTPKTAKPPPSPAASTRPAAPRCTRARRRSGRRPKTSTP